MRRIRRYVPTPLAIILAVLIAGAITLAADGRGFSGLYQTSNEAESGDEVTLTFDTRIDNRSGGDILDATVRLEDPFDCRNPYATWPSVDIANGASVILSAEVTVSMAELDAWRDGAAPLLVVEYLNELGETVRAGVDTTFDLVYAEGGE